MKTRCQQNQGKIPPRAQRFALAAGRRLPAYWLQKRNHSP